jgi:hypothetical protein
MTLAYLAAQSSCYWLGGIQWASDVLGNEGGREMSRDIQMPKGGDN